MPVQLLDLLTERNAQQVAFDKRFRPFELFFIGCRINEKTVMRGWAVNP